MSRINARPLKLQVVGERGFRRPVDQASPGQAIDSYLHEVELRAVRVYECAPEGSGINY
jgi:hypothetical protein